MTMAYPPENGAVQANKNQLPAQATLADAEKMTFQQKIQRVTQLDQTRNDVLRDVLEEHLKMIEKYEAALRFVDGYRHLERQNQIQRDLISSIKGAQKEPFVLVLIDGDSFIFEEHLLQQAGAGGQQASDLLERLVRRHVVYAMPDSPPDVKIVAKVYADVKGVAAKVQQAGIVSNANLVELFYRGFSAGKSLFDVIDVAPGPGNVRVKLASNLKIFLSDLNCHHIFLGCSHSGDHYNSIFDEYGTDQLSLSRMTAIKPAEASRVISNAVNTVLFENLFNPTPLSDDLGGFVHPFSVPKPIGTPSNHSSYATPHVGTRIIPSNGFNFQTTPRGTPSASPFNANSIPFAPPRRDTNASFASNPSSAGPLSAAASVPDTSKAENTPPISRPGTAASGTCKENLPSNAWSTIAKRGHDTAEAEAAKAAALALEEASKPAAALKPKVSSDALLVPSKAQDFLNEGIIPRNRQGQRIDPPTVEYDRTEVQRLRRSKLCNVEYLRGDCPYGSKCQHHHEYNASKKELEYLKLVARLQPCYHGTSCSDLDCIYGHRCILPVRKGTENAQVAVKNCILGEECRFGPEYHGIDSAIVRTTHV